MLSNLSNLHKASTTSYNSLLVKKNYIHPMEDINRNTHIIIQTIYKNLPCIHLQQIQINSFSFQVTHNCSIYTRTIHCRTTKLINHSINPTQQLSHTTNHILHFKRKDTLPISHPFNWYVSLLLLLYYFDYLKIATNLYTYIGIFLTGPSQIIHTYHIAHSKVMVMLPAQPNETHRFPEGSSRSVSFDSCNKRLTTKIEALAIQSILLPST
jgi:hypothetical protein